MAGRPKIYDDTQVIDKAIEIFRDKSYDAASTDELLAAMGIGKGSFYLNFKGGKEELYQRTLKRFAETLNRKVEGEMERCGDQLNYIKELFLKAADQSPIQKSRGCYYGNALVQLSSGEKETKMLAAALLKDLHSIFTKAIKNAQENGRISSAKDPESLGWHLLTFWNGINITKRIQKSPERIRELVEMNFKLLTHI